ncbi:MAG: hypothetical protein CO042_04965 [Parcubacteria group bacterium CG_4_9_14_0_2_um_filter_41_8]|nr:MAG: hypothetical protein CO042_04965 [Parcubacteria group bacterium CG_4_9_14_0_2_um_filter_41_8]
MAFVAGSHTDLRTDDLQRFSSVREERMAASFSRQSLDKFLGIEVERKRGIPEVVKQDLKKDLLNGNREFPRSGDRVVPRHIAFLSYCSREDLRNVMAAFPEDLVILGFAATNLQFPSDFDLEELCFKLFEEQAGCVQRLAGLWGLALSSTNPDLIALIFEECDRNGEWGPALAAFDSPFMESEPVLYYRNNGNYWLGNRPRYVQPEPVSSQWRGIFD